MPTAAPKVETRPIVFPARQQRRWTKHLWLALTALIPLSTMLIAGLPGITTRGSWQNEYVAWHAIRLSWTELWRLLNTIDMVKAAYFAIMHLWTDVFGDSNLALRAPSLLAMCVAVVATAFTARKIFDSNASGAVAGVLLALAPAAVRYGHEIQPYGWQVAGVCVATLIVLYAIPRKTGWLWVAYAVVMTFAGYMQVIAFAIFAVHGLWYLRAGRTGDRGDPMAWPLAAGAAIVATLPIIRAGDKQSSAIGWIKFGRKEFFDFPNGLFMSGAVASLVIGVAVLAVVAALTLKRYRVDMSVLLVWALVPPLLGAATFPILHMFLPRYFLFTMPAWCILASAIASPRLLARPKVGVAMAAALVVGVAVTSLPGRAVATREVVEGRGDFRTIALALAQRQQPGDGIAYGGEDLTYLRQAIKFELRGRASLPKDVFVQIHAAHWGKYQAKECDDPNACAASVPRIWLVTTAPGKDPTIQLFKPKAEVLRKQYVITETVQAQGVRLVLLVRKS